MSDSNVTILAEPAQEQAFPGHSRRGDGLTDRLFRLLTRASVIGVTISLIVHLNFLSVAGIWRLGTVGGAIGGGGDGSTDSVQVTSIEETELGALIESELALATPGIEESATPNTAPGIDLVGDPGGSGLQDTGDLGSVGSGLGGAGTGEGIGVGGGQGGSGGGGARFFGVEARGSRFIFIVDISGSMEGPKMATLKRELVKAIDGLTEDAQFIAYFFESQTATLGSKDKWIEATMKNKNWAITQVGALLAKGGTEPGPAFALAFALKPRADAMYFMTDGLFDPGVADRIAAMNKVGRKIPVHCLAFGERGSEATMRKIAELSGGTYTYIEEPRR